MADETSRVTLEFAQTGGEAVYATMDKLSSVGKDVEKVFTGLYDSSGKAIYRIKEIASVSDSASNSIKRTGDTLAHATKESSHLDQSFGSLALKMVGVYSASQAVVAVGREVINTFKEQITTAISFAAELEAARLSWGGLMGDMQKGRQIFEDIRLGTMSWPTSFEAIETAGLRLKGFGIEGENIKGVLDRLGDAARGQSDELKRLALVYGQTFAQGKANARDLYQFIDAGVPIVQALANAMGRTPGEILDKMKSRELKVAFADIEAAIISLTEKNGLFHGQMEIFAESTMGKYLTNIKTWKNELAEIGNTVLPFLNKQLETLNSILQGFSGRRQAQLVIETLGKEGDPVQAYTALLDDMKRKRTSTPGYKGSALEASDTKALNTIKGYLSKDYIIDGITGELRLRESKSPDPLKSLKGWQVDLSDATGISLTPSTSQSAAIKAIEEKLTEDERWAVKYYGLSSEDAVKPSATFLKRAMEELRKSEYVKDLMPIIAKLSELYKSKQPGTSKEDLSLIRGFGGTGEKYYGGDFPADIAFANFRRDEYMNALGKSLGASTDFSDPFGTFSGIFDQATPEDAAPPEFDLQAFIQTYGGTPEDILERRYGGTGEGYVGREPFTPSLYRDELVYKAMNRLGLSEGASTLPTDAIWFFNLLNRGPLSSDYPEEVYALEKPWIVSGLGVDDERPISLTDRWADVNKFFAESARGRKEPSRLTNTIDDISGLEEVRVAAEFYSKYGFSAEEALARGFGGTGEGYEGYRPFVQDPNYEDVRFSAMNRLGLSEGASTLPTDAIWFFNLLNRGSLSSDYPEEVYALEKPWIVAGLGIDDEKPVSTQDRWSDVNSFFRNSELARKEPSRLTNTIDDISGLEDVRVAAEFYNKYGFSAEEALARGFGGTGEGYIGRTPFIRDPNYEDVRFSAMNRLGLSEGASTLSTDAIWFFNLLNRGPLSSDYPEEAYALEKPWIVAGLGIDDERPASTQDRWADVTAFFRNSELARKEPYRTVGTTDMTDEDWLNIVLAKNEAVKNTVPYNDFFGAGTWRRDNAMGEVSKPDFMPMTNQERYVYGVEELQEKLDNGQISADGFSEGIKKLGESYLESEKNLKAFKEELKGLGELFKNAYSQTVLDGFMQVGEALAGNKNAAGDFGSAVQDMAISLLNNLPLLMLEAGLKALLTAGMEWVGVGLIVGSGLVAIGAGAANYAASGEGGRAGTVENIQGFASGTSYAPGGWAMVGEKGPELMRVPSGAQIIPNHLIKGFANGLNVPSNLNGVVVNVQNTAPGYEVETSERTGPNGEKVLDLMVRKTVYKMAGDGSLHKVLGVKQNGVRIGSK